MVAPHFKSLRNKTKIRSLLLVSVTSLTKLLLILLCVDITDLPFKLKCKLLPKTG